MSLGDQFRQARQQRGLTLSEVAEHIRIRSVYLAAIEDENWSAIGAPVYTRGFLRTYARFLDLDPEAAVAAFNATLPEQRPPPVASAPRYRRERSLAPLIWIAGIVALALIGFVIYLAVAPAGRSQRTAAVPAASGQAGATAVPAAAATPRGQSRTLLLHFTAASWVRVVVDGNVSIEGTFPAGTTKVFHGRSALVRLGNAGGVQITVDGKSQAALGGIGDVAEKNFAL